MEGTASVIDAAVASLPITSNDGFPALPADIPLPPFKERGTLAGPCWFRECLIAPEWKGKFWGSWQSDKGAWYRIGATCRKDPETGLWYLTQWLMGDKRTLTKQGLQKLADHEGASRQAAYNAQPAAPKPASGYAPPSLRAQRKTLELEKEEPEEPYVSYEDYEPVAVLHPIIEAKLYPYQRRPARVMLDALNAYGGTWDCSDMGVGKTYQTLAAAACTFRNIAVICPLSVKTAWARAFRHFGLDWLFIENYEGLRGGSRRWYDPRKGWMNLKPAETVMIFDEAHRCKNPKTGNAGLLQAAIDAGIWTIDASGTMATGAHEMGVTGQSIKLHQGGTDFDKFMKKQGCQFYGNRWVQENGSFYMAKLNRKIFPARGVRITIESLGDTFPETKIAAEPFDVSKAIATAIDKAYEDAELRLEQIRLRQGEGAASKAKQAEFMKAYHEAEMAKVPALIAMAKEHYEAGRSVVLFVNFTDVRQECMKQLGTECGIYGGQSPTMREECISRFQSDRERFIVCNLTAGGVGVSLHDIQGNYPRTSIICPNPRAADFKQAFGRVHRAGGKSKSQQIVFYAAETVEEEICERVREKLLNLDSLNDGDLYPTSAF